MKYQLVFSTHGQAAEINFFVYFDNNLVGEFACIGSAHLIEYELSEEQDDIERPRCVTITMLGKNQSHTVLDSQNQIKSDCYCLLDKIIFDQIDVTDQFCQGQAKYFQTTSTGEDGVDDFFGFLGINGKVILDFSTPLYKWMLSKCQ